MLTKMLLFTVNGYEIPGLYNTEHELELFLTGMT
jgi:hypothetical protein